MPLHLKLTPAAALLSLALAGPAQADDSAPDPVRPLWSVNGFGTVGLAHSDQHGADYVFDNLQPNGAGRSRQWSGDVDSRLGLQLTANFSPQLSGLVQVVSEYRWDDTYLPTVTWANLKYAFTPDFSVRAGRIGPSSFLASDSRRVGYANITARPPAEVYRLLALKEADGVEGSYRQHFGDISNTARLLYGRRTVTNTRAVDVHSTNVMGVFDTLEKGALTLHAAYQVRDVDNQNPPRGHFMSLGAAWDPGDCFLTSEWVRARNYDLRGAQLIREAWYVTGGVRVGMLSPYVTLAELRPRTQTSALPIGQHSYATGVRWDAARNLDVKLQWDQLHLASGSYGTLQNVAAGTPRGGQVNVLSLLADFLY